MRVLVVSTILGAFSCAVRDMSLSRLVDEGFGVVDEVIARDSYGVERVVALFPHRSRTEIVPSWLLGGGEEGKSIIHLGGMLGWSSRKIEYEILEREDWIISFYELFRGEFDGSDLMAITVSELLRRSRFTAAVGTIYFSRPNNSFWSYAIREKPPKLPQYTPNPFGFLFTNHRLTFRQLSEVIQANVEWSLLLRRHPHLARAALATFRDTKFSFIHDKLSVVLAESKLGDSRILERCENLGDLLTHVAHVIHDKQWPIDRKPNFDNFIRHAFFFDSPTPDPMETGNNWAGLPTQYNFKALPDVLGDEFRDYQIDFVRYKFQEFVRLIEYEWDLAEPNPAAIPSIVQLIEEKIILK
jgi:hypothetical protein